jgi:hypothetical protein
MKDKCNKVYVVSVSAKSGKSLGWTQMFDKTLSICTSKDLYPSM